MLFFAKYLIVESERKDKNRLPVYQNYHFSEKKPLRQLRFRTEISMYSHSLLLFPLAVVMGQSYDVIFIESAVL